MDPGMVTAAVAAVMAALATWQASRKDASAAGEASDVRREELLSKGLEMHFVRLEAQVAEANARVDELTRRVSDLESERIRMLAWLSVNGLAWPPDRSVLD